LQDLRCSGADAPIVTPERSNQTLFDATEDATTSTLAPLPRERVRSLTRSRHQAWSNALRTRRPWHAAKKDQLPNR
jgi:hypothetical protein